MAAKKFNPLTCKLYYYLLVYGDGEMKPSIVSMAAKVGITRQTCSTQYKTLLAEDLIEIDEDGRLYVYNVYDFDVAKLRLIIEAYPEYSGEEIGLLMMHDKHPFADFVQLCKMTGVFYSTFENKGYRRKLFGRLVPQDEDKYIVFGIIFDDEIYFVGSTANFNNRIKEEMARRPYLNRNSFVILKRCTREKLLEQEKFFIQIFNPKWNRVK